MRQKYQGFPVVHPKCALCARREKFARTARCDEELLTESQKHQEMTAIPMPSTQAECCIRGYHVYHRKWFPTVGEILNTTREGDNPHDRYAVAVLEASWGSFEKKEVIFPLLASISTRERSHTCALIMRPKNG